MLNLPTIYREIMQKQAFTWAKASFGESVATNRQERAKRLLEEALELAQAEGVDYGEIWMLTRHVYMKPPGEPAQEVGGIGVTLLIYCEAVGLSASGCEETELNRVLSKPPEHWRERHNAKADAGVAMPTDA